MTRRNVLILVLIVAAMLLISCSYDMPSRSVPVETPEGPMLDLPNPTITATNTRIAWKPASYVASEDPPNSQNFGSCQGYTIFPGVTGQNWGYYDPKWIDLEPSRGVFDFSSIDTQLARLASGDTLVIKVIFNMPTTASVVPDWAREFIYMLPATSRSTIASYNMLDVSRRLVCSPDNYRAYNANELTAQQELDYETWCLTSQRVAGWDSGFRMLLDELMEALANEYDNNPLVSGIIIHGGGDYGEAGMHYACLGNLQPTPTGTPAAPKTDCENITGYTLGGDVEEAENTVVRTMAEIFGVSATSLTQSCYADDASGTFGTIFDGDWYYTSCWSRYYSYAIKAIIDTYKEHWRATPLIFSGGAGISKNGGGVSTSNHLVGVSYDVLSYAQNCYGNYSVYGKQDGWGNSTTFYYLLWLNAFAKGNITVDGEPLGKTIGGMEPGAAFTLGNEQYWLDQAAAYTSMMSCIRGQDYHTSMIASYNTFATQQATNFNTYAKSGIAAYVAPEPVSCLGGVAYPTPTATPTGPTNTPTQTRTPTQTATPGGPTATFTVTSTPVPGSNSITIYSLQDSWMSVTAPTTNFGTYTTMSIRHAGNSRPILQFDLSSIPAGATISSAELRYTVTSWDYGTSSKTFEIYQVDESWSEYGVTWNSRDGSNAWSTGGAAYSTDLGTATITSAGQKSFVSAALNTLVQNWFSETEDNYGLVFVSWESSFQSAIASREHSEPPRLIVYYTIPTATATPTPTPTSTLSVSMYSGREIVVNPGFEIAGAGGADVFAGWTELLDAGGAIEDETGTCHWGGHSAKLTSAGASTARIRQDFGVAAAQTYRLTIWTRGDETYGGRYQVYDVTNSANIIATTAMGVITTTWSPVVVAFTVPADCTTVRVLLWSPSTSGGIAYFDDVSLVRTDAHYYTASPGQVITYTTYITSNATITESILYDSYLVGVPTEIASTPEATWNNDYKRFEWADLTVNLTPQPFVAIWQIPTAQAPGGQLYRNFMQYTDDGETLATATVDVMAYANTYTPTPTPTYTRTPTPTPTRTSTPTPAAQLFVNEVVPAPTSVDWNIDGQYNYKDQWVELFNGKTSAQDISTYYLTITGSTSTITYTFPVSVTIGAWDYLIVWPWAQAGTVLSNTNYITLYNSSLVQVDAVTVPGATPNAAYVRMPDAGSWQWWTWPSFGLPNARATPTQTPTVTPTRTPTVTATP